MNFMEDQQAPQSAEGEAKVITVCGSTKFEAEFAQVNQRLVFADGSIPWTLAPEGWHPLVRQPPFVIMAGIQG
jgi:hypothetical protein